MQGPLSSTVDDFWAMVYEQRSSVVLMLTRTIESKNVEKVGPLSLWRLLIHHLSYSQMIKFGGV